MRVHALPIIAVQQGELSVAQLSFVLDSRGLICFLTMIIIRIMFVQTIQLVLTNLGTAAFGTF